jgi:hypothetical protein
MELIRRILDRLGFSREVDDGPFILPRTGRRRQKWLPASRRKKGGVVIRSAIDARLDDGRRKIEEHFQ